MNRFEDVDDLIEGLRAFTPRADIRVDQTGPIPVLNVKVPQRFCREVRAVLNITQPPFVRISVDPLPWWKNLWMSYSVTVWTGIMATTWETR